MESSDAEPEAWMKRLGEKAGTRLTLVEKKVEEKVDEAVDRAFDKTEESI